MALFSNKNRKNGAGAPGEVTKATTTGTPAKTTPQAATKAPQTQQRIAESKPNTGEHLSEAAIRARAHQIWVARGGGQGDELSDWLLARQELEAMEESSGRSASSGGTT